MSFNVLNTLTHALPIAKNPSKGDLNLGQSQVEFEAHRNGDKVELKWSVTGFVKYFYVERSLDKVNWEPILNMTGSNQTFHRTEYFDIDYNVPSTKLFYRIKQVYFNGETTTSHTAFVPSFDELSTLEERMIKSITDPITIGSKIDLFFVNFSEEDLLLVLRDQCGEEFYAKVTYLTDEKIYKVTNISADIPSGQYLITASSKRNIYSSSLRIEYNN